VLLSVNWNTHFQSHVSWLSERITMFEAFNSLTLTSEFELFCFIYVNVMFVPIAICLLQFYEVSVEHVK